MKHNDSERIEWVLNDEGLYRWQRRSRLSMTRFVREYREEIDSVIDAVMGGARPAHYLVYG